MPKLSLLVSKLNVDGKTYNNPEWWASKHKITRKVKREQIYNDLIQQHIKGKLDTSVSYRLNGEAETADSYVKRMSTLLDVPQYSEYAPWNPVFRKYTTVPIILK
jgi:hypothetical protein